MATFTPPTSPEKSWGDPNDESYKLFRYFGQQQTGRTIYKDSEGNWQDSWYVWNGAEYLTFYNGELIQNESKPGLKDANPVYMGGHKYEVSVLEALDLTVAGYGAYINQEPVSLKFENEDLKWLTRRLVTWDATLSLKDVYVEGMCLVGGMNQGGTAGAGNTGNIRTVYTHANTAGWTDVHMRCERLAPLEYGGGYDIGNILPQQGLCTRYQFNSSIGKYTCISLNNNTFLVVPFLNIGVWVFNGDGTGLSNRQVSVPIEPLNALGFPYGFEATVIGTTVDVRIFPANQPNPSDGSIYQRTVDLNSFGDTVSIPTPTGPGESGMILNHMGYDSRSYARVGPSTFTRLS